MMKAAAWIAGGRRFESAAGKIFYRRQQGSGTPLVVFHGLPTWSYDYSSSPPSSRSTTCSHSGV